MLLFALFLWFGDAGTTTLYGGGAFTPRFFTITWDGSAATIATTLLTMPGFSVRSVRSVTTRPSDGTTWAVITTTLARVLAIIDPLTSVANAVGPILGATGVSSIVWSPDGSTLYAATGSGGVPSQTLYTLNPVTAVLSAPLSPLLTPSGDGRVLVQTATGLYYAGGNAVPQLHQIFIGTPGSLVTIGTMTPPGETFALGHDYSTGITYVSEISSQVGTMNLATAARSIVAPTWLPNPVCAGACNDDIRGFAVFQTQSGSE